MPLNEMVDADRAGHRDRTHHNNTSRPGSVESLVQEMTGRGAEIGNLIERKFASLAPVHDRMDADYSLYTLSGWQPDLLDALSPEDIYTTNEPRVLAEKVISFITATELVVRAPNDEAQERQEVANDLAEQLAIGMLNNIERRHRRLGQPPLVDALAFYAVVRGRYAAARAVLRKRPNGETFEDILPLDPRHLFVQPGAEEPLWASYRLRRSLAEVREQYGGVLETGFEKIRDDESGLDVFEYFTREPNPVFDIASANPFRRHPFVYLAGTVINGQWARVPHDLHMLSFPVVVSPVGPQPPVAPTQTDDTPDVHFGESVFAENRGVWDRLNRAASYVLDLTGKASDPRKKVFSLDGTRALDDGANEKGAEINLSTANQEDVQAFPEADINGAAALLIQQLQKDSVAGACLHRRSGCWISPSPLLHCDSSGTILNTGSCHACEPLPVASKAAWKTCWPSMEPVDSGRSASLAGGSTTIDLPTGWSPRGTSAGTIQLKSACRWPCRKTR